MKRRMNHSVQQNLSKYSSTKVRKSYKKWHIIQCNAIHSNFKRFNVLQVFQRIPNHSTLCKSFNGVVNSKRLKVRRFCEKGNFVLKSEVLQLKATVTFLHVRKFLKQLCIF